MSGIAKRTYLTLNLSQIEFGIGPILESDRRSPGRAAVLMSANDLNFRHIHFKKALGMPILLFSECRSVSHAPVDPGSASDPIGDR